MSRVGDAVQQHRFIAHTKVHLGDLRFLFTGPEGYKHDNVSSMKI